MRKQSAASSQQSAEKHLRRLVQRYRRLVVRLLEEGVNYTMDGDCVFCSGCADYRGPEYDPENGEVKHSRKCPTRQADKLAAVET